MKFLTQTVVIAILISSTTSCQTTNSKDKIIFDKNKCYDEKLVPLKKTKLYNEVMPAFRDTFQVLKTKKEYFGVPEVVTIQIDDAVFFKKDSSECMLLVLQKSGHPELIFATARTVRGFLKDNNNVTLMLAWIFILKKITLNFSKRTALRTFQNSPGIVF